MLKAKEFMTAKQKDFFEGFEAGIEAEYALCLMEIQKANQSIKWGDTSLSKQEQDYANSEIDAIRKYWYNRLEALVNFMSWRNPKFLEELGRKYNLAK